MADFTFFSSGEIVSFLGATPVFVDVDSDTFNIDKPKLEPTIQRKISEKKLISKVIIPFDLICFTANYAEIQKVTDKYNLLVLENGAQGFGGSIDVKKVDSFGHSTTTSFFQAKPLGCYGYGGALFTNNDELEKSIRLLKVHSKGESKYDNIRIGVNSRLDTIQIAILNVNLTAFINHELEDVNRISKINTKYLKDFVHTLYMSSFAQYTIRLKKREIRDELQNQLK